MTIREPLARGIAPGLVGGGMVAVALSLGHAAPALAAQTGVDYDCTDFDSRSDAQDFYEDMGGPSYDPFNLDDDNDGRACEEWSGEYRKNADGADGVNGDDGADRDCDDFATPEDAEAYFLADGGSSKQNIDHLDPNHNGIACEEGEPG